MTESKSNAHTSMTVFIAGVFFFLALIIIVSAFLSYWSFRRVAQNESLVNHTNDVIRMARATLLDLTDAETGQRGYLLTGEDEYLEPYRSALATIEIHLKELERLTQDNPAQNRLAIEIEASARARLATLLEALGRHDRQGTDAARQFILEGQGRRQMVVVRRQIEAFEAEELRLLKERKTQSDRSRQLAVATLGTSAAVGLALVISSYLLTARQAKTRHEAAMALDRANRELEKRVAERTHELATLNESLRRSNRELEQFASVASHDLQEPLRKIQAFGDRLQTRFANELGEQGRDYVERMQSSAQRMRNLIDALLNYSRVTTKAQPFVPVDLHQLAQEVTSDLEARLQQTGGSVELESLPTIDADPLQMRQLLQNMIGNGLKFHKPGANPVVRVTAQIFEPAPEESHLGPFCEIRIEDNGIGFEEQYRDRIFEVFQRLHGRQEYEGTGIGLAICRRIVQRHLGTISVNSIPDQGTTFVIRLPQRQPQDNQR